MDLARILGTPRQRKITQLDINCQAPERPSLTREALATQQLLSLTGTKRQDTLSILLSSPLSPSRLQVIVSTVTIDPSFAFESIDSALPSLCASLIASEERNAMRAYFSRALVRWQTDPVLRRCRTLMPSIAVLIGRSPRPKPLADDEIAGLLPSLTTVATQSKSTDEFNTIRLALLGSHDGSSGGLLSESRNALSDLWQGLEAAGCGPPSSVHEPLELVDDEGSLFFGPEVDEASDTGVECDAPEDGLEGVGVARAANAIVAYELDEDGTCWVGTADETATTAKPHDSGRSSVTFPSTHYSASLDAVADADIIATVTAGLQDDGASVSQTLASSLDPELQHCIIQSLRLVKGSVLPQLHRERDRLAMINCFDTSVECSLKSEPVASSFSESLATFRHRYVPEIDQLIHNLQAAVEAARNLGVDCTAAAGSKRKAGDRSALATDTSTPYASISLLKVGSSASKKSKVAHQKNRKAEVHQTHESGSKFRVLTQRRPPDNLGRLRKS